MSGRIFFVCDYLSRFSSKWAAKPYRSGMKKELLSKYFKDEGYKPIFTSFPKINTKYNFGDNDFILYTSSEDFDLHYKSYIEDIILGLELSGANIVPSYKFLRAHHNKVFMEILRNLFLSDLSTGLNSISFGTLEDLKKHKDLIQDYPVVIKSSFGASSHSVRKAEDFDNLFKIAKRLSSSRNVLLQLRDFIRSLRHKGYTRTSQHRKKFIVQDYIPDLPGDWKILIFGKKYYVLERKTKPDDFRASGSGLLLYPDEIPDGLLHYAKKIYERFSLPFLAVDIASNGESFFLIEFQAIYFGTHTLDTSPYYYENISGDDFIKKIGESNLEKIFAYSVTDYISKKY